MKTRLILLLLCIDVVCYAADYNHDYSQTWTTKMFLSKPDGRGGSQVNLTFEQALEIIRQTDQLTLGVPKIIYLVGWQYNGHDDKYPAFFEVNPALKRKQDATAQESLQWLMKEAKKYNTVVSFHINMTDAYDDSPLWQEYVDNDLISKNKDGGLMVIGEYNNRKAYQINYRNEWNKGYTQIRIDRLFQLIPELREAGTIHIDAWIARPSEGHNESVIVEADYQKKALQYWKAKGVDVTSEWVMDYMVGHIPLAWHFNAFSQGDYLAIPADKYTGVGINSDLKSSDFGLAFLFGTSSYGEPFWIHPQVWREPLTKDFMLKCPQYFYLNTHKRLSVKGLGNNRVAHYSENIKVSLADSTIMQGSRILRHKNTICIPAVWRTDHGIIVYSPDSNGKTSFDIPYLWERTKHCTLYQITTEGLKILKKIPIKDFKISIDIESNVPYYVIPDETP